MNEYNSIIDKLYSKPNLSIALLLSLIMILFTRRKQVKVTKNKTKQNKTKKKIILCAGPTDLKLQTIIVKLHEMF